VEGHDHCIIRLAYPGVIKGIVIDTTYFTGNCPPAASLEGCCVAGDPDAGAAWTEIIPPIAVTGNVVESVTVSNDGLWTHVRFNIFPDGGVARLRIYGQVKPDWRAMAGKSVDVAAIEHGGRIIASSDQHYSLTANILYPGTASSMADGWETHRRREPGHEWAIVELGCAARIGRVEVDTAYFRGNYPDRCSLQAAYVEKVNEQAIVTESMFWRTIVPEAKLEMDKIHIFGDSLVDAGVVTHCRFNMIPDGGISRLRIIGELSGIASRGK
jgi:allantoicase